MTFLELLLIGICVLLALIAIGMRFVIHELRGIRIHLAEEKAHRERRGGG